MRAFLITAAILFSLLVRVSSQDLSAIDSYLDKLRRDKGMVTQNELEYKDIQGSPYLDEQFRQGSMHMKSGTTLTGEFRYDIYADRIEFRKDGQVFHIAIPDSISKLFTQEATIVYLKYVDKTDQKKGYFIAVYEGYYSVFEKRTKVFQKAQPPQPYQDAPIPASFQDAATEIYMKVGDNPAFKVTSLNEIVASCGTESAAAREFIKKNKTRFRDKDDLAGLFRHLNGNISK